MEYRQSPLRVHSRALHPSQPDQGFDGSHRVVLGRTRNAGPSKRKGERKVRDVPRAFAPKINAGYPHGFADAQTRRELKP